MLAQRGPSLKTGDRDQNMNRCKMPTTVIENLIFYREGPLKLKPISQL